MTRNLKYVVALLLAGAIAIGQEVVRGGTVVTGTSPVSVTANVVSMSAAGAGVSGYLTNSAGQLVVDAGIVVIGPDSSRFGSGGISTDGGATIYAANGATSATITTVASTLTLGALAQCNATSGTRFTVRNAGAAFVVIDADTATVSADLGGYTSGQASGANAYGVTTNGARIDFGAGASDYASSDGTTVTFAGPVTTGLFAPSSLASTTLTTNSSISTGTNGAFDVTSVGTGFKVAGTVAFSPGLPTVTSACTTPDVDHGTATSFQVDVGNTCAGISTMVLGLPTATNGWDCRARHQTVASAATAYLECAGDTATAITCTNFARLTGMATAFTDNDDLVISCTGR